MKKFTEIINKTRIAFAILVLTTIMTSCIAFHEGNMQNSASLSQANFEYVMNNVYAESSTGYFLGLGGDGGALVYEAKRELNKKYKLKSNQTFANITVNFTKTYYLGLLYIENTCTISADVVEFTK